MSWWSTDPNVELNFPSGILRVTVRPSQRLLILLIGVAVALGILAIFLPRWYALSLFVRSCIVLGLIGDFGILIFKLFGTEVIEFNQQSIVVCKEIRGWERRREYPTAECREMRWDEGAGVEGDPQGVKFKAGKRWIRFGDEISEEQANKIFLELQNHLPMVAAQVFSFSEKKSSFLELGLNK